MEKGLINCCIPVIRHAGKSRSNYETLSLEYFRCCGFAKQLTCYLIAFCDRRRQFPLKDFIINEEIRNSFIEGTEKAKDEA
jgi:hypothetical protein